MKLHYIVIIILSLGLMTSCTKEFEANDIFPVSELPGYVAFNAPGNTVNVETVTVAETDESASIEVEIPTGTLSAVTVNYSYAGSAIEGVDFTIDGASGGNGTVVIEPDQSDFQNPDRASIEITILTDDVVDEDKELTFTLESASNDEGSIAVGRGGTDFNKTATLVITNVDE